jgi:hypothetical protein
LQQRNTYHLDIGSHQLSMQYLQLSH